MWQDGWSIFIRLPVLQDAQNQSGQQLLYALDVSLLMASLLTLFQKVGRWLKRKLDKPLTESNVFTFRWSSHMKSLTFPQIMDGLKRQLDTLLIEWKPQNFDPIDVGMDPVKVC